MAVQRIVGGVELEDDLLRGAAMRPMPEARRCQTRRNSRGRRWPASCADAPADRAPDAASSAACCSADLTARTAWSAAFTASQIASASAASVLPRLT
jgi:hypothetical protein